MVQEGPVWREGGSRSFRTIFYHFEKSQEAMYCHTSSPALSYAGWEGGFRVRVGVRVGGKGIKVLKSILLEYREALYHHIGIVKRTPQAVQRQGDKEECERETSREKNY